MALLILTVLAINIYHKKTYQAGIWFEKKKSKIFVSYLISTARSKDIIFGTGIFSATGRKVKGMGVRLQRKKEDVTDSVGLLISILVRYPEVATINYEPEKQILKFNFISARNIEEKEISRMKALVLDSIEVFNFLEGRQTGVVALNHQAIDQLTLIEVQRDMDTLVQEEISMIVDLFRQHLLPSLVTEINEDRKSVV